jgi:hypothetical protein
MPLTRSPLGTLLLTASALAAGYAAHTLQDGLQTVHAQSHGSSSQPRTDEPLDFQLSGIGPTSALTVYNPVEHVLYVYQGVTQGDAHVNCSFSLRISHPGAAVERRNCAPGTAF